MNECQFKQHALGGLSLEMLLVGVNVCEDPMNYSLKVKQCTIGTFTSKPLQRGGGVIACSERQFACFRPGLSVKVEACASY